MMQNKPKFHVDGTLPENDTDIFVFGSNLAGIHGGGAARVASDKYYRPYGTHTSIGMYESFSGLRTYGIPTKNKRIQSLSLEKIRKHVDDFVLYVINNPNQEFFVTRIGCQLAGYSNSDIAPMFKMLGTCSNVSLAKEWEQYVI